MIVSIDIGTSYSSISLLDPQGAAQPVDINTGVSMHGGKYSLPSAIFVEDNGTLMLGQAALNSRFRNPQNFRDEFKRNLGENIPFLLGNRSFLPEEVYTVFFRHMKACAENVSGEAVELAYVTHPANYSTAKKDKILAAAKAAGLFNVELVDEPTAAAMGYCVDGYVEDGQNVLIYDFGGGTFDVSLIRYENGSFSLLTGALGLERCGGVDIDRLIFRDMISKIPEDILQMLQKNNLHYLRFVSQLSEQVVKCKHHLSSADSFSGDIMIGFDSIPYTLTLDSFNQMIAGMVGQTIQTCRQILQNAKLNVNDLSSILLVGGTSRVRLVQDMVRQMAGTVPVYNAADMELAISQGALNYRNYKAHKEDPEALYQQGCTFWDEKKYEEAFEAFQKAANLDHVDAQYCLGKYYAFYKKDHEKALPWYQKAAEQGNATAQCQLGYHYKPLQGAAVDAKQGAYWFRKAAEQGYEEAQYELGKCYETGAGVEQDKAEAVRWYQEAADQDWPLAPRKLAHAYEYGEGVPKDLKQAQKWYQVDADDGDIEAKEALQRVTALLQQQESQANQVTNPKALDEKGLELSRQGKWREAFESFQKAADINYADAQYHLAGCYEHGRGTEKDLNNAKIWYHRAATQGQPDAKKRLQAFSDAQTNAHTSRSTQNTASKRSIEEIVKQVLSEFSEADEGWGTKSKYSLPGYVQIRAEDKVLGGSFQLNHVLTQKGINRLRNADTFITWHALAEAEIYKDSAVFVRNAQNERKVFLSPYLPTTYMLAFLQRLQELLKSSWDQLQPEQASTREEHTDANREHDPKYLYEKGLQLSRQGKLREAFEAFQKAADMNYADAQYRLACCYERGEGTVVDWSNALIWFHRAAAQGNIAARDRLRKETAVTTPEQIIRKLLKETPSIRNSDYNIWIVDFGQNLPGGTTFGLLKKCFDDVQRSYGRQTMLIAHWMVHTYLFRPDAISYLILTDKGIATKIHSQGTEKYITWKDFAASPLKFEVPYHVYCGEEKIPYGYTLGKDYQKFWTRLHEELQALY